jgi:6-pyruvoyltetrahydropterin/6-carboxytetrahydropterin synthase
MYTVSETIYFSYGHRLLDYQGKCAHLHGHNGRVEVILEAAALDGRSMVEDFDRIGAELRAWIGAQLDHRMLLRRDDPLVAPLVEAGEPLFLMDENPTAEVIARLVHEAARSIGLPVAEVRLWETEQSIASYRADR